MPKINSSKMDVVYGQRPRLSKLSNDSFELPIDKDKQINDVKARLGMWCDQPEVSSYRSRSSLPINIGFSQNNDSEFKYLDLGTMKEKDISFKFPELEYSTNV